MGKNQCVICQGQGKVSDEDQEQLLWALECARWVLKLHECLKDANEAELELAKEIFGQVGLRNRKSSKRLRLNGQDKDFLKGLGISI